MNHQNNCSTHTVNSSNTDMGSIAPQSTRSMNILRKKDLAKKLSCSESTIDNRRSRTGRWRDETFPEPIPLGAGGSRSCAIGWIEYVVDEWIENRIKGSRRK